MYKPNPIEIKKLNEALPPIRYEYFIKKVADFEEVWGLRAKDGWATCMLNENECFPFWPAKIYAESCIAGDWSDYYAESIHLDEFISDWIPDMIKDNHFIALFPVLGGEKSILIDPARFLYDLETELEKYDYSGLD